MQSHRLGLILVGVSTLAWSTAGLFTRAITENLITVIVWRGLFGGLGLLAVLLVLQGPGGLRGFFPFQFPGDVRLRQVREVELASQESGRC